MRAVSLWGREFEEINGQRGRKRKFPVDGHPQTLPPWNGLKAEGFVVVETSIAGKND